MEWGSSEVLVCWLRLLGWRVVMKRHGELYVAVASRHEDGGHDLVAGAVASSLDELPLAIFSAACARLEEQREPALDEAPELIVA